MDIYTTMIAISIVVYIAIGNDAGRGVKRLDEKKTLRFSCLMMLVIGTIARSSEI